MMMMMIMNRKIKYLSLILKFRLIILIRFSKKCYRCRTRVMKKSRSKELIGKVQEIIEGQYLLRLPQSYLIKHRMITILA